MNLITRSIQKELNHFFKVVKSKEFDSQELSKSALTQARAKLKHTAFIDLNELVVNDFYDNQPWMTWKGRRVVGIDGSAAALPDSPKLREIYGVHAFGPSQRPRVLSRISFLYDCLNGVILNASLGKYTDSEQNLGRTHFEHLKEGDVVLYDRYYPAIWLFLALQSKGVDFVGRMDLKKWKSVNKVVQEGKSDTILEFKVHKDHYPLLDELGVKERKIKIRIIVTDQIEDGEKLVLCTSFFDQEEFTREEMAGLYKNRWGIEESYKEMKCRLDLENFTGKTPHAILQDFYAKVFISNLCTYLTLEQQIEIENRQAENTQKHRYKINRSFALSTLKDLPIHFFLKKNLIRALKAFKALIAKSTEPIRPGRKFERRTTPRKPSKMHYKPI